MTLQDHRARVWLEARACLSSPIFRSTPPGRPLLADAIPERIRKTLRRRIRVRARCDPSPLPAAAGRTGDRNPSELPPRLTRALTSERCIDVLDPLVPERDLLPDFAREAFG